MPWGAVESSRPIVTRCVMGGARRLKPRRTNFGGPIEQLQVSAELKLAGMLVARLNLYDVDKLRAQVREGDAELPPIIPDEINAVIQSRHTRAGRNRLRRSSGQVIDSRRPCCNITPIILAHSQRGHQS